MALFHSLMSYKTEGRLESFDMHDDRRATVRLKNGNDFVVYMADKYIIGLSEVAEAAEAPKADYFVFNAWDVIGSGAKAEARRCGIEVRAFGAFGHELDSLNAKG